MGLCLKQQGLFPFVIIAISLMGYIKTIKEAFVMMNFINNGGLELILGAIYVGWIFLMAKLDNMREPEEKPVKWHW